MSEQTAVVDPEGEADHIGIRQNSGAGKQRPETPAAFCSGHGLCQRDRSEGVRSEEHTSELQSQSNLVCRLLLEKKKKIATSTTPLYNALHTCTRTDSSL